MRHFKQAPHYRTSKRGKKFRAGRGSVKPKKRKARYPSFNKNTTNAEYKQKLRGLNPFADYDKDGVKNIDDCRPFDKKRQDERPGTEEVIGFYEEAFGRKPYSRSDSYFKEWERRFESPKRAWNNSDYARREILKKRYPKQFGDLDKDTNLNNPEYEGMYNEW